LIQFEIGKYFRHTGALCAMKEVNIIPEDAKSIESLKQLQQVGYLCIPFTLKTINYDNSWAGFSFVAVTNIDITSCNF
jgi:hypothetical protein